MIWKQADQLLPIVQVTSPATKYPPPADARDEVQIARPQQAREAGFVHRPTSTKVGQPPRGLALARGATRARSRACTSKRRQRAPPMCCIGHLSDPSRTHLVQSTGERRSVGVISALLACAVGNPLRAACVGFARFAAEWERGGSAMWGAC
eukprot:CAMPEP_0183354462 /NCGR_PEP_ID=MMETSP0164_2-20130417/37326_1 /TAXON_ID=221442 /ORGANISM="Coccolithus pelagicus ssp braarudi, Strain PLY182g" /LENGTH=150 /DNA_ID=CAMNT_0025527347 /DNA_START=209 /DNA_END=658 /DNA_ORIENTATION=+